ncbi:MAG TPA: asparagine synthase-related protein [Geminicoccaceae bacterium]|jgi:asparagine synthase (glutamine-hydrolysing)|nr:asparagine synthase-related protein [Geminicoccaceae bacterium]
MRYLAAAGPPEALEEHLRELGRMAFEDLVPVIDVPGFAAWTLPGTPAVHGEDGRSLAVGLLFERASGRRMDRIPAPLPDERNFSARFWGAYVLFAMQGPGHSVLRDPSGNLTAYHRRMGPIEVYASDAALLAAASPAPIRPDTEFLRDWLTYPFLRSARTGWEGTGEIVPGTLRRVDGAAAQVRQAWSPWDHALGDASLDDFEEAAAGIRTAVLHAVPRLAQHAADPVVRLSGGLDSAIVAAALANGGVRYRAVTFATRAPDGDERSFSRAAAQHWNIRLAELVEDPQMPDFGQVGPLALRPPANAVLQVLHRAIESHLAQTGSDLVLGGTGGDNVFCFLGTASSVLDALRVRGPGDAARAVRDLAQMHGTTVRAVMRAAWRRSRKPMASWRRDDTFLAPGAAAEQPPRHPWLEPPARVPRGKLEHLQSIMSIRHFLADPGPGRTAAIHPLLAQPVLEACLRVPTWLWVRGGRDRAVARRAFADLLPPAIAARRSKGGLGSMVSSAYLAGRGQLEALLLDGKLASMRLLDRDAVAATLRRPGEPEAAYLRLLDMAAAETWLRGLEP